MANVLIAYGTGEGQTAKISAYIARDRCHDAELVDEVQRLTEDGGLMLTKLTTTSAHGGQVRSTASMLSSSHSSPSWQLEAYPCSSPIYEASKG
jgi:hypothetical protein